MNKNKINSKEIKKLLNRIQNINEVKLKFREDITLSIFEEISTNSPYKFFVFEHPEEKLLYGANIAYDLNPDDNAPRIMFFEPNEITMEDYRDDDEFAPFRKLKESLEEKYGIKFSTEYCEEDYHYVCPCGNAKFFVSFDRSVLWGHTFTCTECKNSIIDNYDNDDDDE